MIIEKLMPAFKVPVREPVENHLTGEVFTLRSVDASFEETPGLCEQIQEICNEPEVYAFMFKRCLRGKPYPLERVQHFIEWAKTGWANNEWFVFFIVDRFDQVAGKIGIRSNNIEGAEIAYWLSRKKSGLMTNTILKLLELARLAGFKKLFALVSADNLRSARVLERAGFENVGQICREEQELTKYKISLG